MENKLHKQQQKINLIVVLEHRFRKTPDGAIWTLTMFPYEFWQRYLEVFDRVRVVARVCDVESVPPNWKRVNGEGVSFVPIPYYIGVQQYLSRVQQVNQAVRNAFTPGDAVIMRVPSQVATHLLPLLKQYQYPYGVEVVADPYDVFAPGSVKHPLRPFFRWWFPRRLRRLCASACAAAYVTENALQSRYPAGINTFSTFYSDVELPDSAFVSVPPILNQQDLPTDNVSTVIATQGSNPNHLTSPNECVSPKKDKDVFRLISVGTMDQLYKAPDVLIEAVAECIREGLNLELVFVGDGKYRGELEAKAADLGLGERVSFLGWLPAGNAVRRELDQADVFVLPSHQEGLPRAMVEAMARGLPCIGSNVGGIPELLHPRDMVPPGDAEALASKIAEVVTNPQRMARMSTCNLQKAKDYAGESLHQRRIQFYRHVRSKTEEWLQNQAQTCGHKSTAVTNAELIWEK
ncbi:MAG: glycosyltransferase family 4 protein [Calothrix sp. MO_192.B10]|nr:glycosyltransferase family 4 protein [Calothrix sp. MO_192.B10]